MGDNENTFRQIKGNLYEDEYIIWRRFYDLVYFFDLEKSDMVILDGTNMESEILYNIIKLNCHLSKPVLALVGEISAAKENCIWGMGVTDIIRLPFTRDECREKIDNSYRWKWYFDRCKCRNTNCTS